MSRAINDSFLSLSLWLIPENCSRLRLRRSRLSFGTMGDCAWGKERRESKCRLQERKEEAMREAGKAEDKVLLLCSIEENGGANRCLLFARRHLRLRLPITQMAKDKKVHSHFRPTHELGGPLVGPFPSPPFFSSRVWPASPVSLFCLFWENGKTGHGSCAWSSITNRAVLAVAADTTQASRRGSMSLSRPQTNFLFVSFSFGLLSILLSNCFPGCPSSQLPASLLPPNPMGPAYSTSICSPRSWWSALAKRKERKKKEKKSGPGSQPITNRIANGPITHLLPPSLYLSDGTSTW